MDPIDIAFIKGIVTFSVVALTTLAAYWLRLRSKALTGSNQPELEQLQEDLSLTRTTLESRVLELEERLDFAERRLLQAGAPPVEPANLRVPTPV